MRRQILYVTVPVCAAMLAAGAWLARAGALNPPPGPVSPTMRTLDEIYDAVTADTSSSCPPCEWKYKFQEVFSCSIGGFEVLPPGTSGVLHGIWLSRNVTIANGPLSFENTIGAFSGGSDGRSTFIQLDVPFDNGLTASCYPDLNGTSFTILYRLTE